MWVVVCGNVQEFTWVVVCGNVWELTWVVVCGNVQEPTWVVVRGNIRELTWVVVCGNVAEELLSRIRSIQCFRLDWGLAEVIQSAVWIVENIVLFCTGVVACARVALQAPCKINIALFDCHFEGIQWDKYQYIRGILNAAIYINFRLCV